MPKVELETQYMIEGVRYGPGLADVPIELAISLGLVSSAPENKFDEKEETQETEDEEKLNINSATAEEMADRLSGVGLNTAKKVVELREAQPEKKLTSLEQLKQIPRADWDALASEIDF